MAHCAECGTLLYHIDEACPNCLAGSGMCDRPPTNPAVNELIELRTKLTALRSELREAKDLNEELVGALEPIFRDMCDDCKEVGSCGKYIEDKETYENPCLQRDAAEAILAKAKEGPK